MAREEKARTKGTGFVKLVKKGKDGEWIELLLVHNLSKPMPDGKPKNVGWGTPGGGVREDENEYEGTLRELFEESNAFLNVVRELMKEFIGREHEFGYLEYMNEEDQKKVLTIHRFEKMPERLDSLTREIKRLKIEDPRLKPAVEERNAIITEYASAAKKFGLIKMIGQPTPENGRDGGTHTTWLFEVDAADILNIDDLGTRNEIAGNVDGWMWAMREYLEERGRNYKNSFGKPDYIYVKHLRRLGLIQD
ncbi:MAG: NUDIX domain-containing protein [bacterium]|nr:NUDIX domain-containing protein [bacterium]